VSNSAASEIIAGAEYVRQITALESDRRARSAFQSLVLHLAPSGSRVFDFGAGPGIDARFYAERGRVVAAYDVDSRMCEFFAAYCREAMDAGQIVLQSGTYPHFLSSDAPGIDRDVDLVTANFAPLNLITDLHALFARFHSLTAPGGKVLASVLSPYFVGDLKYGWWWRNALRLWREGRYCVPGAQAPIFRRRLADLAVQCAPYFTLVRVYPGLPPTGEAGSAGIDVSAGAGGAALRLTRCQFMFLLFEKQHLIHE